MAARSNSSSVTPRNIFVGLLILCLALALFFIPELIRFYGVMTGKNGKPTAVARTVITDVVKRPSKSDSEGDPLGKVLNRIESGSFDTKNRLSPTSASNARGSFWSRIFGGPRGAISGNTVERSKVVSDLIAEQGLNWTTLQRPEVNGAIRGAIRLVRDMNKDLSHTSRRSHVAIERYLAGLTRFSQGELRQYSAEEALRYIGQLDMDVTRAFVADRIDREMYARWLALGIEPLLKHSGAYEFKRQRVPPFRGDIVLTSVNIQDVVRAQPKGRAAFRTRSVVRLQGIIYGNDVTKVELRRNGALVDSADLRPLKRGTVARPFRFGYSSNGPQNVIDGIYTVRILDKRGMSIWKAYQFLPQAQRFRGTAPGRYEIPVMRNVDLRTGSVDRRLDKVFLVGVKGATSGASNADSGGGSFSTFTESSGSYVRF